MTTEHGKTFRMCLISYTTKRIEALILSTKGKAMDYTPHSRGPRRSAPKGTPRLRLTTRFEETMRPHVSPYIVSCRKSSCDDPFAGLGRIKNHQIPNRTRKWAQIRSFPDCPPNRARLLWEHDRPQDSPPPSCPPLSSNVRVLGLHDHVRRAKEPEGAVQGIRRSRSSAASPP